MGSWGHEYVRGLSGEMGEEYHARQAAEEPLDDLLELVSLIVPYHMSHNAGARSSSSPFARSSWQKPPLPCVVAAAAARLHRGPSFKPR